MFGFLYLGSTASSLYRIDLTLHIFLGNYALNNILLKMSGHVDIGGGGVRVKASVIFFGTSRCQQLYLKYTEPLSLLRTVWDHRIVKTCGLGFGRGNTL